MISISLNNTHHSVYYQTSLFIDQAKELKQRSIKKLKVLYSKLHELEMKNQSDKLKNITGGVSDNAFGSQIRSYVLHPYSMVKDHRTNYEVGDVNKVMDGYIDEFIEEYLRKGVE